MRGIDAAGAVKAVAAARRRGRAADRCRAAGTRLSDTPVEVEYYRNGGILHTVLRKMAKS